MHYKGINISYVLSLIVSEWENGMQWQSGGSDSGLFPLAFTTSLCSGIDPITVTFTQSQMRPHLLLCIEKRSMSMFSYKHQHSNPKTTSNDSSTSLLYMPTA